MAAAVPQRTAEDQPRPACPCARLQTSGNRTWRARQVDPAQAANDGEGLADNGPGWPDAEPQPEARRASRSRMARPHAHRHGDGRWVRVCRDELSVPDQDRQKDHRSALVGPALLWAAGGRCGAPEQWGARWLNRTRLRDGPPKSARCAIYTRKSSEEGLEQAFNSLDAQREACAAFILSQKHEGWTVSPTLYDDGGFSGGTMERPALKRLIADIEAGQIDVVVVYKVDRLTRALSDFAKLVEVFDRRGVSFVSITQQFNTTTSMGRLTLNVLLSFAQFEREVIGERVRDKIAASKKKGMWMGGMPPLGYDVKDRKLVVNDDEARTRRRHLSALSRAQVGSRAQGRRLQRQGSRSKRRMRPDGTDYGGQKFSRGALYLMLQNRIYRGEITHKGNSYPGEHPAIIDQPLWDEVQAVACRRTGSSGRRAHAQSTRACWPAWYLTRRRAADANTCGQERNALSVLCFDLPPHRAQTEPFQRQADTGRRFGRPGDRPASLISRRPCSGPRCHRRRIAQRLRAKPTDRARPSDRGRTRGPGAGRGQSDAHGAVLPRGNQLRSHRNHISPDTVLPRCSLGNRSI